jgi:hypothetical protein
MFVERYIRALNASNLRDDQVNTQTEALAAVAFADLVGKRGSMFGSLLVRVKYADPVQHKTFECGNANLALLLRVWTEEVTRRGKARQWMKIRHEWDIKAAEGMYEKIARMSLAHWLAGACEQCKDNQVDQGHMCLHCKGSGKEPVKGGAMEVERIKDMVSELERMCQSHIRRASAKLRRAGQG